LFYKFSKVFSLEQGIIHYHKSRHIFLLKRELDI